MKITIQVESGKVVLQIDDEEPIAIRPKKRANIPPLPAQRAKRDCIICGQEFRPSNNRQQICGRPTCIAQQKKKYKLEHPKETKPASECGYCRRRGSPCVRHGGSPATFTPAIPKPPAERVPNKVPKQAKRDKQNFGFDDPWDCMMCRNAGALCLMHEKMTADGKVPPNKF